MGNKLNNQIEIHPGYPHSKKKITLNSDLIMYQHPVSYTNGHVRINYKPIIEISPNILPQTKIEMDVYFNLHLMDNITTNEIPLCRIKDMEDLFSMIDHSPTQNKDTLYFTELPARIAMMNHIYQIKQNLNEIIRMLDESLINTPARLLLHTKSNINGSRIYKLKIMDKEDE